MTAFNPLLAVIGLTAFGVGAFFALHPRHIGHGPGHSNRSSELVNAGVLPSL
jgi:hypothetical protein